MPNKSLYRQSALQHYAQQREKDVLPQFVSPPVFLLLWILLLLLLAAIVVAWLEQVPIYANAGGIVVNPSASTTTAAQAVIFVPAIESSHLHSGMPVTITLLSTGQGINTTITSVGTATMSPSDAQKQYQLGQNMTSVVPGPSVTVQVNLGTAVPAKTYAGSLLSARIEVGTQRLLSLLPGIGGLIGG